MFVRSMIPAFALCCCCLCECAASRANDPPAATQIPATNPDADALRGPTVTQSLDRPHHSIVQRDFNGRIKKAEEHPVLLALARLDLAPEEKAAADKVLGERAAALDTIVRDNLRLIVEFALAMQASDSQTLAKLQPEILNKAQPFFKRGPLLAELMPALPDEKFAQLKKMVNEYNTLAAQDRAADPMSGKDKPNRFGAVIAQGFENSGTEVRASFDRVVGAGVKEFDALIKMLQLTPEQEATVRQKAGDLFQKTYGKPTKRQQLMIFLDIYGLLDTDQRHRLAQYIGDQSRVKRSAGKPAKS
jgi:hypothetical protein